MRGESVAGALGLSLRPTTVKRIVEKFAFDFGLPEWRVGTTAHKALVNFLNVPLRSVARKWPVNFFGYSFCSSTT